MDTETYIFPASEKLQEDLSALMDFIRATTAGTEDFLADNLLLLNAQNSQVFAFDPRS